MVGGAEAGGVEGSIAVLCDGLIPLFWMVLVCRVILLRWGLW